MSKVTVVMPAYNAGKTRRDNYERLLGQPVDEIILVDDRSEILTCRLFLP